MLTLLLAVVSVTPSPPPHATLPPKIVHTIAAGYPAKRAEFTLHVTGAVAIDYCSVFKTRKGGPGVGGPSRKIDGGWVKVARIAEPIAQYLASGLLWVLDGGDEPEGLPPFAQVAEVEAVE